MSRPVHLSIRDDLRIRITEGEWSAGERLPSETELAAWYGVARMTIRQAVGALATEGILVRRQGLGTFATERRPARRTGLLQSFTEEIRAQGHDLQTQLIKAAVERPPAAAREALQLGESAAAVLVRRVRIVDGSPTVLQNSWLPYTRFAGLDADPFLDGSLYAMLEGPFGVRLVRARQTMTAAAVDAADADILGLQAGDPVLRVARVSYDSSNLAVEFAMSVTRPGYPVEATLERLPAQARAVVPPARRAEIPSG